MGRAYAGGRKACPTRLAASPCLIASALPAISIAAPAILYLAVDTFDCQVLARANGMDCAGSKTLDQAPESLPFWDMRQLGTLGPI